MADNFAITADRMMLDARALYQTKAHRSACYLAWYVVECTLKSLLEQAGAKPWGHDLQSLHDDVATLLVQGNAVVAKYGDPSRLAPTMLQQVDPPKTNKKDVEYFCHWDPRHRYDGARWNSAVSADYLREAEQSHDVLIGMYLDGLVVL